VAEYESEQYRVHELKFHQFEGHIFSNGTDKETEVVKTVARMAAEDGTQRFSMGVFIPSYAPVNYRGELMTVYFTVL
jgi:hypothetical protein